MSLELDRRTDLPILQSPGQEPYQPQTNHNAHQSGHSTLYTSPREHVPKKPTVFLLGTALAAMTVLAVVAAAVGGSIAMKRKHEWVIQGHLENKTNTSSSGSTDLRSSSTIIAPQI